MAAAVPCLAKELEVQVLKLEASDVDDVCDTLEIGFSGYSHSYRNLSLFEPDFACHDGGALDTLDSSLFDAPDNGAAWCHDVTLSPGPSSAASCEQSDGDVAEHNMGLELCSGHLATCASSGKITPGASDDAWEYGPSIEYSHSPCGVLRNLTRRDSRNSLSNTPSWRSGGGHFNSNLLNQNSYDSDLQTDGSAHQCPFQSSFIPAPGCLESFSTPPWGAPSPTPHASSGLMKLSGQRSMIRTARVPEVDVLSTQQLCLIRDVSPDLTLHLKEGALASDLPLLTPMSLMEGDGEPLMFSKQHRQLSTNKKRSHEPASPRVAGIKRASSNSGVVARKLMSHPEGHTCTQCGVKSTPVWRAGPLGPKTLCNACGVRYSKIVRKK